MAEGGGSENEGENTIVGGSEFVFDFYCEVCRDDGNNVEAGGFCVDCDEYLCGSCVKVHKKARPSRHHKLLDTSEMPKDNPLSQDRVSKEITTTCTDHTGEPVKFYCQLHGTFGCTTCFATTHKACDRVVSILEKSETYLDSDEFKAFTKNLKSMKQSLTSLNERLRENKSATEQCCLEAISSIREFRKQINTALDKVEHHLVTRAETIASDEIVKFENLEQQASEVSQRVNAISSEIDKLQASRRVCQLYISANELSNETNELRDRMNQADTANAAKHVKFEGNNEIFVLLEYMTAFGHLSVNDTTDNTIKSSKNASDTTAVHMFDIAFTLKGPSRYVASSVVMSKHRLVVSDLHQHAIGVFDTESTRLLAKFTNCSNPFDLALVDSNRFAVTQYNERNILLISMGDEMVVDKTITIANNGRGLAYSKGRLLVTFQEYPRLEVLNLNGNVIKTIQHATDGKKIFSYPRQICVSNDDETIYISDLSSHKIISLSFDGNVRAKYSIIDPRQLCTDQHGHVFVCGGSEKNVHVLSPDLTLIKIILTQADWLDGKVLSISHCHDTDKLLVGMENKHIKVYQLS